MGEVYEGEVDTRQDVEAGYDGPSIIELCEREGCEPEWCSTCYEPASCQPVCVWCRFCGRDMSREMNEVMESNWWEDCGGDGG